MLSFGKTKLIVVIVSVLVMPLGLIILLVQNRDSEHLEYHSAETKTEANEFAGLESDYFDDLVDESTFACPEEQSGTSFPEYELIRFSEIVAVLENIPAQLLTHEQLEFAFSKAGFSVPLSDNLLADFAHENDQWGSVELTELGYGHASQEETDFIDSVIKANSNFEDHFGDEITRKLFMGYPIFLYILKMNPSESKSIISDLVDLGISPQLLDLISAIEEDVDPELIKLLMQHSNDETTVSWTFQGSSNTITSLLASKFEWQLLDYWLIIHKGSKNKRLEAPSELDSLPIPKLNQVELAMNTVEILNKHGRSVSSIQSKRRLETWLAEDQLESIRYDFDVPLLSAQLESELEILNKINKKYRDLINYKGEFDKYCNVPISADSLLDSTASYHQRLEYFKVKLERSTITNFSHQLYLTEMPPDLEAVKNELLMLLAERDWNSAMPLIMEFSGTEFIATVLSAALDNVLNDEREDSNSAAFAVYLLNEGAVIPDNAIYSIANPQIAKELDAFGLNIHFVDESGRNGLSQLALLSQSGIAYIPMFKYLLAEGVSMYVENAPLDSLSLSIESSTKSNAAVPLIELLLENGAQVGEVHIEQLGEMRKKHPMKYKALSENFPSLNIGT